MSERRLLMVHAHPDDECIGTGGTLARYASECAHVCLVTCTNGEVGEIAEIPDLPSPDELRPVLGRFRQGELRQACDVLGVEDLRMLGYHDSGMQGTPDNEAPVAFVNQPFDEVVGRIVEAIRDVRPQVAVTYNEIGFYGHPDHIRAHEALVAAIPAAADPDAYPGTGGAWRVSKLYYTAMPRSRLQQARAFFASIDAEAARDMEFSEEEIERLGTPDELVTTHIDVAGFVALKFKALEAHRTQLGTTGWFLSIPEEVRALAMGVESYVLASSTVPRPEGLEDDLFAGLDV